MGRWCDDCTTGGSREDTHTHHTMRDTHIT